MILMVDTNGAAALVGRLRESENESEQIKALQQLNRFLLTHRISFDGITVQPLLVEAYYNSGTFQDENSHRKPLQRNHFAKFNFHRVGYGGIDVCFSNSDDYFLSFLIKCAFIYRTDSETDDGRVFSQVHIPREIIRLTQKSKAQIEDMSLDFEKSGLCENGIVYTQRKNTPKGKYVRHPLAALYITPQRLLTDIAPSLQKGCKKQFVTALFCMQSADRIYDTEMKKHAEQIAGGKIEERVWKEAAKYWQEFF